MDTNPSSTATPEATTVAEVSIKRRGAKPKTDRNLALAADYDNGFSLEELAEKYGLKMNSTKALVMRFRRLGLVKRQAQGRLPQHVERDAEIYRRYIQEGLTTRQLADQYGVTAANISRIISDTELAQEHGDNFVYLPVPKEIAVALSENRLDAVVTNVLHKVSLTALSR